MAGHTPASLARCFHCDEIAHAPQKRLQRKMETGQKELTSREHRWSEATPKARFQTGKPGFSKPDALLVPAQEILNVPFRQMSDGYQGDERPQKAHILIRRQHVGTAANDVGWERQPDGSYRAWISEYDGQHRFNQQMQNRIKQEYAYQVIERQQRARGRSVTRERLPNGELEVTIAGYR